ncbi:uncharacterized protein Z520_11013 [Fonsecaea multimorphosa CBS 102226]|uniref:Uncharacterized protein n=1 Tax=Fonsecaea multimorphosa CBS 102226 TaxID=1442371 RepID=A0A0D2GV08_9EURO|nr:uncharacterized protein Z520_11013 [Fonsecaea multimorphosa CBS 102226]KIX93370.1 hypothetical protein Z520_11013 [Fonsecaea multimorphosa CBS 102226]OAL18606.1 hypothetical protein AYO22_10583 [Fonsecaea multimorphosa]
MWFAKRRSSLAAESAQTEPEPRRRNRLSKPPTSNAIKVSTGISTSSLKIQGPLPQSKNASGTELSSPLSPVSGNAALRQQPQDDTTATEPSSPLHAHKNDSGFSVAYMVSQLESKAAGAGTSPSRSMQQLAAPPLSPIKPPKRRSLLLRRLSLQRSSSISRTPSSERINPLESDTAAVPPADASMDRLVDQPSIPPMRRASFAPGTATRKPSQIATKQDIESHNPISELEERGASAFDVDDFDWQPPPPRTIGRAGTPSDISYSHLGGLRHGSLQIVNGRASPTFSEVSKASKQLLSAPAPRRGVSSDYGDADEDFDLLVSTSGNLSNLRSSPPNGNTEYRYFSWEHNDDKAGPRIHPLQSVMTAQKDDHAVSADDQTSLMAREYIAELGVGPFDQQEPSSPVGTIRRTRSEGSLWRASSCSSIQKSPPPDNPPVELPPVSPLERPSFPTGSVVRKASIRSEESRSQQIQRNDTTNDEARPCESPMSWYSPIEPRDSIDEGFQSAVEFHPQFSAPSLELPPPRAPEKSDSGYSSSNSLRSLQIARLTPSPAKFRALPEVPDVQEATDVPDPSRAPSFSAERTSILRSRRSEPYVPTFSNLQPSAVSSNPTPIVQAIKAPEPEPLPAKPAGARKKLLKKRRPSSQPPSQVAVVRVRSFEVENIPQVSPQAQENLRIRSHAVPELEQTYSSLGGGASTSTLFLPLNEIRFPSPAPEQVLKSKPKRPRSRSRPRSWFGRPKEEKVRSRDSSGMSQTEALAIINDLGTVSTSLGKSPYDFADASSVSKGSRHSTMTAGFRQPRPMMDDETAVELARTRSRSLRERESIISDRRFSFNDRGGIPGKNLRTASLASDAPPITQDMIEKAYRTSSMQRQPSVNNEVGPPPPPHSPRPEYICYGEDSDVVAPPPPSHSPRPIDITPDPWAAQAAVWKARRLSAGEALRRHSGEAQKHHQGYDEAADELLYPVIPPQHAAQELEWKQSLSPEEFSSSFHDYYDGYNESRRPQRQRYSSYTSSHHAPYESESAYVRQSRRNSRNHDHGQPHGRAVQSRGPSSGGAYSSRSRSYANSVRSFASSCGEDLHPAQLERQHPPPAFGRYSGGLNYGYERGNGFGGSAGTRSMSGKAETPWKGVPLRASVGVDLGDVPFGIMARG